MKLIIFLLMLGYAQAQDIFIAGDNFFPQPEVVNQVNVEINLIQPYAVYCYYPDEVLRYNYIENTWGYAAPGEILRYNPIENEWEYAYPNEVLQYNSYNNTWEYTRRTK